MVNGDSCAPLDKPSSKAEPAARKTVAAMTSPPVYSLSLSRQPRLDHRYWYERKMPVLCPLDGGASTTTSPWLPCDWLSLNRQSEAPHHTFSVSQHMFLVDTKYIFRSLLGRGAYSTVARCLVSSESNNKLTHTSSKSEQHVAVKCIPRFLDFLMDAHRIYRECQVMMSCRHPAICPLLDIIEPFGNEALAHGLRDLYLVTPAYDLDLARAMRLDDFGFHHLRFYLYQLLSGVAYLHAHGIAHRDLKPQNLFIECLTNQLVIGDFGLARWFTAPDDPVVGGSGQKPSSMTNRRDARLTEYVVTRHYRAPELLGRSKMGESYYDPSKVDMWSIGCILAEMLHPSRAVLFRGDSPLNQLQRIISTLGTPSRTLQQTLFCPVAIQFLDKLSRVQRIPWKVQFPDANPLVLDLLDRLLTWDPQQRLSAEEALQHPLFRDYVHCEAFQHRYHQWPAPPIRRLPAWELKLQQVYREQQPKTARLLLHDLFWQLLLRFRPHTGSKHTMWRQLHRSGIANRRSSAIVTTSRDAKTCLEPPVMSSAVVTVRSAPCSPFMGSLAVSKTSPCSSLTGNASDLSHSEVHSSTQTQAQPHSKSQEPQTQLSRSDSNRANDSQSMPISSQSSSSSSSQSSQSSSLNSPMLISPPVSP